MDENEYNRMEEERALGELGDKLLAALKEFDSGRWDWDQIDCGLTGKDADLEPHGDQGIHLDSVTEDTVTFTVHGYKSFTGNDICLNLPPEIEDDDEKFEAARKAYLSQAQGVIEGTAYSGFWDGDDWEFSFDETVTIPWVGDGDTMYEDTAKVIIAKAEEVIKPWEDDMRLADGMLDQLAGWVDEKGERCESGKPPKCAAWISNTLENDEDDDD